MQTVRPMSPNIRMAAADADEMAIAVLGFLAEDAGRLSRFLDMTGLAPETIRRAASSPGFFLAVLDHVAADEALLVAAASHLSVTPERIMAARRLLSPTEPLD